MLENNSGNPPTTDDINAWLSSYGITHPLLNDGEKTQIDYVKIGWPTYVVIDKGMKIVNADMWPFDADYIISLL